MWCCILCWQCLPPRDRDSRSDIRDKWAAVAVELGLWDMSHRFGLLRHQISGRFLGPSGDTLRVIRMEAALF